MKCDLAPATHEETLAAQEAHACFKQASGQRSPLHFHLFHEPGGTQSCVCMRCLLTVTMRRDHHQGIRASGYVRGLSANHARRSFNTPTARSPRLQRVLPEKIRSG